MIPPKSLEECVKWAKGAEEFELKYILMDHDLFMLNQLFPK